MPGPVGHAAAVTAPQPGSHRLDQRHWEQAIRRGLLAPAGVDQLHHEQMWRLSQRARRVVPVPPAHVDVYRLAPPEEVGGSEHAGLLPPEIEDPVE